MKKVEELKDLGCSVRGRFYDLAWSKPVLRAPAVHGVSSYESDLIFLNTIAVRATLPCRCNLVTFSATANHMLEQMRTWRVIAIRLIINL